MLRKFFIGTATDFRYRIPLTFYPLLAVCVLGFILTPELPQSLQMRMTLTAIFALGLALRVWGSSFLTSAIVVDAKAHDEILIDLGPFALIRHPLYSGAGLMILAIALPLPLFITVPFFLYESVMGLRLALYEEKLMLAKFGETYRSYLARTGRFAPHFFRLKNFAARRLFTCGPLQGALLSEFTFVLYGFVLICAFVWNDSRILYAGVIAASLVGGFLVKKFAKQAKF